MSDFPPDGVSEELWGAPDFEGRTHEQPLPDWFSSSKSLLPACHHWREPVGLLDEVVVFASAWLDRPMTGRGVDMRWPDVGFYLWTGAGPPGCSSARPGSGRPSPSGRRARSWLSVA
jgi:hypothetical protein